MEIAVHNMAGQGKKPGETRKKRRRYNAVNQN